MLIHYHYTRHNTGWLVSEIKCDHKTSTRTITIGYTHTNLHPDNSDLKKSKMYHYIFYSECQKIVWYSINNLAFYVLFLFWGYKAQTENLHYTNL